MIEKKQGRETIKKISSKNKVKLSKGRIEITGISYMKFDFVAKIIIFLLKNFFSSFD